MGLAALQQDRPGGGRTRCMPTRVCGRSCGEFHRGGLPRAVVILCELVCLFYCPSTGRRDSGGPLPPVSGREVVYIRPREERLGFFCLLLEGQPSRPPPESIPGGGNGSVGHHKKVRAVAQGEEGALPMVPGGVYRASLRGAQPRLLALGSGIHGGGDVWGDV